MKEPDGSRKDKAKNKPPAELKSLEKALQLLESFGDQTPELSATDLANRLSIPRVSVYRFLRVLMDHSLIDQNEKTKKYRLGIKVFELGSSMMKNFPFREIAFPMIMELSKRSGETVHLGVLDHGQVVSIEGVESGQSLRISLPIGKRVSLHSTGIGKAILAFLTDQEIQQVIKQRGLPRFTNNTITDAEHLMKEILLIRRRGYAVDDEENEPGVRCVAAPIFDASRRVIASISISGPSVRIHHGKIPELSAMVIKTSRNISKALGYSLK